MLFRFSDPRITESSGLAAGSFGGVFTHNDSGDTARIFRIDAHGNTVAVYGLRGARNVDWEDMATGTDAAGHRILYLADIGDNTRSRKEIDVYEVPEPSGPSADLSWVRYRFAYPDGAHDAEALLVDPRTRRMYIAAKTLTGKGTLYVAPAALSKTTLNRLAPVRSVPAMTTSADFSPDGSHVVLLTYLRAYWANGVNGDLHAFAVPMQQQNEAIAFTADGSALLVGSEGTHSKVYRLPLPWANEAGASAARPSRSSPSMSPPVSPRSNNRATSSTKIAVIVAGAAGVLVVASLAGLALKRRAG